MTVKAQDEGLIQILGELDSLKKTVKAQDESLIQLLSKIESVRKMEEEDERSAHFQTDRNLARKIQKEDDRPAHCQKEGDSVTTTEEQDECNVHFKNEGDQVRNLAIRAQKRHVRFNDIVEVRIIPPRMDEDEDEFEDDDGACYQDELNSVTTMEMKHDLYAHSPDVVGLTPSNFKASRAKVVSQTSPCHTPGRRQVKICYKKVDYSKVKAKVDTWRKT
jgi:hypothetical protein